MSNQYTYTPLGGINYSIINNNPDPRYTLATNNVNGVYVPLATKNTYGVVKVGDGLDVVNGEISVSSEIIIQYHEMPEPTEELEGTIVQYVGNTTANYTNGYFYKCTNSEWHNILVQPASDYPQSDLAETDTTDPSYVKNKYTANLTNNGHDGTHPFVDTEDLATETTNRTNAINELKTDSAHSLELSMNNTTYVMTAVLKNSAGTALSTQTIDFPLETLVLSVSYDSATKELVITLKNGTTTRVSVADLVSGLVPNTRRVNGKVLSDDISLTAENVGALPDDTVIPTNTSDLNNDSGFVTGSDLPTVNNATITLTQGGVSKGSFTLNQSSNATIELDEGGGGTPTDVKIDGTSITVNNVADLATTGGYNASTNKVVLESRLGIARLS